MLITDVLVTPLLLKGTLAMTNFHSNFISRSYRRSLLVGLCFIAVCVTNPIARGQDFPWTRIQYDDVFRSEGATAFDVNKDGKMDVITGEVWYDGATKKMFEIRKPGTYDGAKGYSQSFACFGHDVNADGWTDLICVGFPGAPCHWFANPKGKDQHWEKHEIWRSACNESPQFGDVTGDGKPELVLGSQPEGQVGYLEIPAADVCTQPWKFVAVSTEKSKGTDRFYHGLGIGDVNRDGRNDIIIPDGWWEQPQANATGPWTFHPLVLSKDGKGSSLKAADIHIDDLDLDGDNEIIMSSAHDRGVWWFENIGNNAEPKYEYRQIDDIFSQTHALNFADINGDGVKDLITGKRFYAHGPKGDADPEGEVVMYWYEIKKTRGMAPTIIPHKIHEGSGTGIGTQFQTIDFNGDGKLDIVLSNKKGTNVLVQK